MGSEMCIRDRLFTSATTFSDDDDDDDDEAAESPKGEVDNMAAIVARRRGCDRSRMECSCRATATSVSGARSLRLPNPCKPGATATATALISIPLTDDTASTSSLAVLVSTACWKLRSKRLSDDENYKAM